MLTIWPRPLKRFANSMQQMSKNSQKYRGLEEANAPFFEGVIRVNVPIICSLNTHLISDSTMAQELNWLDRNLNLENQRWMQLVFETSLQSEGKPTE